MLAGVDLIRKIHKKGSFCLTCPLLLNADGVKMGKTVNGALWLDSKKQAHMNFINIGETFVIAKYMMF